MEASRAAAAQPDAIKMFSFGVFSKLEGAVTAGMIHLGDRFGLYTFLAKNSNVTSKEIAEKATATLTEMLDEIEKSPPTDAKGRELVPLWIADYRIYISNRAEYISQLRAGQSGRLNETVIEGVPISEKISKFARENRMKSCQAPYDLVS